MNPVTNALFMFWAFVKCLCISSQRTFACVRPKKPCLDCHYPMLLGQLVLLDKDPWYTDGILLVGCQGAGGLVVIPLTCESEYTQLDGYWEHELVRVMLVLQQSLGSFWKNWLS